LSGFRFVTAQSEGPITKNDGIFIDSHDMGVILVGRVWYDDVFGETHYTDFCKHTLAKSPAISMCGVHNEIK
jgi:hypothetical protein